MVTFLWAHAYPESRCCSFHLWMSWFPCYLWLTWYSLNVRSFIPNPSISLKSLSRHIIQINFKNPLPPRIGLPWFFLPCPSHTRSNQMQALFHIPPCQAGPYILVTGNSPLYLSYCPPGGHNRGQKSGNSLFASTKRGSLDYSMPTTPNYLGCSRRAKHRYSTPK